jgi:hypothetical protein
MVIRTCNTARFARRSFRPLRSKWVSGLPVLVSAPWISSIPLFDSHRGTGIHPCTDGPRSIRYPGPLHMLSPPFLKTKHPIAHIGHTTIFYYKYNNKKKAVFTQKHSHTKRTSGYQERTNLVMVLPCLVTRCRSNKWDPQEPSSLPFTGFLFLVQ